MLLPAGADILPGRIPALCSLGVLMVWWERGTILYGRDDRLLLACMEQTSIRRLLSPTLRWRDTAAFLPASGTRVSWVLVLCRAG